MVSKIAEIFANLSKNLSIIGMLKNLKRTFKMGLIIKFQRNSKTIKMIISEKNSNMIVYFKKNYVFYLSMC